MKKLKLFYLFVFFGSLLRGQDIDLTKYVNPMIGTGGHGHTYPGATMPFGMVQLSPDTRLDGWDGCSGYHYSDTLIYGFSHTHLNGTGASDYGDILMMPVSGNFFVTNYGYSSPFDHKDEIATPGYYSVLLKKNKIKAELTTSLRTGIHRYTFPSKENNKIVVDLKHRDIVLESTLEVVDDHTLRGMRRSKAWADNQVIYFEIKFSVPFIDYQIFDNYKEISKTKYYNCKNLIASFSFKDSDMITATVALSPTSMDDASNNLIAETENKSFDQVAKDAKAKWNEQLSKVIITSKDKDKMTVFYTALYHSLINPNIYNNTDGSYLGRDFKKHKNPGFDYYTVFSLWDTYRAEHPLLSIIDRNRTSDFVNTFITEFKQGGLLPVWELASNETFCMIGYHAVPVIYDSYAKGIGGFDTNDALKSMINSATQKHFGLESLVSFGYIPGNVEHESVSKTLEYSYDDWCISMMAKKLKDNETYHTFITRSQFYKNIYDSQTGFMRPKYNGAWMKNFDPTEVTFDFTEANSWQYSFYVPHDINGLIKLHGGRSNFSKKLDELFTTSKGLSGRQQSDITGLIGQYAHGNEPSHHMAYLYNYIGQPYKTQEIVNKIMCDFYKNTPDGLIGNEDCGQMSAWFVLSSMGFYQVCPGNTQFSFGSPLFNQAIINLEDGKQFIIKTLNLNEKNKYIKSVLLNGQEIQRSYVDYNEILAGGIIIFTMDSIPSPNWGRNEIPSTKISDNLLTPSPYSTISDRTFTDKLNVELKTIDNSDIYYTLDNTKPTKKSIKYSKPIILDKSTDINFISYNPTTGFSYMEKSKYFKINQNYKLTLYSKYSPQYTAGGDNALIDNIRGTNNFRLGEWQGFYNTDFKAVLDLGKIKKFNSINAEFMQDIAAWIWLPDYVEFEYSTDGINYKKHGKIENNISSKENNSIIHNFKSENKIKARYIRITAKTFGTIPEWHLGAGNPSWLFIDEIWVE